jgi:hypothetical protein
MLRGSTTDRNVIPMSPEQVAPEIGMNLLTIIISDNYCHSTNYQQNYVLLFYGILPISTYAYHGSHMANLSGDLRCRQYIGMDLDTHVGKLNQPKAPTYLTCIYSQLISYGQKI